MKSFLINNNIEKLLIKDSECFFAHLKFQSLYSVLSSADDLLLCCQFMLFLCALYFTSQSLTLNV